MPFPSQFGEGGVKIRPMPRDTAVKTFDLVGENLDAAREKEHRKMVFSRFGKTHHDIGVLPKPMLAFVNVRILW